MFTCGGVGPTLDDVTFQGIAAAFGSALHEHPELVQIIRDHVSGQMEPGHLQMARVPEETELVRTEELSWPAAKVRNVYVLPGSPELVQKKWAALRDEFRAAPFIVHRVFTTLDEVFVAHHLDAIHVAFPDIDIGSYPLWTPTDHSVQVTLEGKSPERVQAACDALVEQLGPAAIVRIG